MYGKVTEAVYIPFCLGAFYSRLFEYGVEAACNSGAFLF